MRFRHGIGSAGRALAALTLGVLLACASEGWYPVRSLTPACDGETLRVVTVNADTLVLDHARVESRDIIGTPRGSPSEVFRLPRAQVLTVEIWGEGRRRGPSQTALVTLGVVAAALGLLVLVNLSEGDSGP